MVPKGSRRLTDVADMIISLYAGYQALPPLAKIPDEVYPGEVYASEEVVTSNRLKAAWEETIRTFNPCPPPWKVYGKTCEVASDYYANPSRDHGM